MDKNPSTQGMVGCLDAAYKKWDAELNKNYKALTSKMDATQKAALLAAQRKWIDQSAVQQTASWQLLIIGS